jgi:hypothetical protein
VLHGSPSPSFARPARCGHAARTGTLAPIQVRGPPAGHQGRIAQRKSTRLTSEKPVVRTHLRPPRFRQLHCLFETLIGDSGTTAGNHRCMLPDGGGVPGGQGVHRSGPPGCAVRRQASAAAGAAWVLQEPAVSDLAGACRHCCEPGGWRTPEEAWAIWLGGRRRDRCSTKEGFLSSSRLQHALMPM